jgi:PAS domain-containing protein
MFVYFGGQLHFAFALVKRRAAPAWLLAVIYGPAIALSVLNFLVPFSLEATVTSGGGIQLQRAASGPIHPVWLTYAAACWLIPVAFYVQRYRSATLNRVRLQSRLLIRVILIVFVLVLCEYYVPIVVPGWEIPSQSPVLMSIWVGAMVYAIWKYGFLRISPRLLTEEILDSVEDLVLLYDLEGNRVYENRKANTVLGTGKALALFSPDPLKRPVARLLHHTSSWGNGEPERRLRLRVPDGPVAPERWFTIDGRVKPAFDTFGDPLGVVVSGSVMPQETEVRHDFQFTDRESEVLDFLVAGWTICRTAKALHITARTV